MVKDKKIQGKKNRASGTEFERKVRKDIEKKGWIVSKWMNNVKFKTDIPKENQYDYINYGKYGKLIPAKHKFRGPGIPMAIGTGFVDFLVMRRITNKEILEMMKNE